MGKTNKANLLRDEEVSDAVREYPCLYDKACKEYKERDRVENAWRKVDEKLSLEEGEGKLFWENLIKRYRKKRSATSKVLKSGAGTEEVAPAKLELKKYAFLSFIDAHINMRQTQTNIACSVKDEDVDSSGEAQIDIPESLETFSTVDIEEPDVENIENTPLRAIHEVGAPRAKRQNLVESRDVREKAHGNGEKDPQRELNVANAEARALENVAKALGSLSQVPDKGAYRAEPKDADDAFFDVIAMELKMLPEHIKFRVKHEINTIIYTAKSCMFTSHSSTSAASANFGINSAATSPQPQHSSEYGGAAASPEFWTSFGQ